MGNVLTIPTTHKAQPIPDAALKKHIAILGTNGSGKTSVAKSQVVEPALAAGERVCCIDPTGVMWGVRLGADGKPAGGFPVYIVGGEHADFPLSRRDGEVWAEIVGTSSDSFIFDTSLMTVSDRTTWFTAFAETLIRKNKGPLRVVLDEAHLFAPQGGAKSGGLAPDMLHAANNLLALGRSKGLRVTMISQRPAKLHKDSLSQAHTLIAMKLIAPQDRAAIKEWVADQTDPENGKELIASLPSLVPGEGWVWAPAEGILDRVRFPRPITYDSSQAPEDGDGDGPKLESIDHAAIQGRLALVAEEVKANDPARLKARIAELERRPTSASPETLKAEYDRGFVDATAGAQAALAESRKQGYAEAAHDLGGKVMQITSDMVLAFQGAAPQPIAAPAPVRLSPAPIYVAPKPPSVSLEASASRSPSSEKVVLAVIAAYPTGVTLQTAAKRAGLSQRSSAFRRYLTEAAADHRIEDRGDGRYVAREGQPGIVAPQGLAEFKARLPGSYAAILSALEDTTAADLDTISIMSGVSRTSSGLTAGLRELVDLGLAERDGNRWSLHPDFR